MEDPLPEPEVSWDLQFVTMQILVLEGRGGEPITNYPKAE